MTEQQNFLKMKTLNTQSVTKSFRKVIAFSIFKLYKILFDLQSDLVKHRAFCVFVVQNNNSG